MPRWGSQLIKSLRQFLFLKIWAEFFLEFFLIFEFYFFGFFLENF